MKAKKIVDRSSTMKECCDQVCVTSLKDASRMATERIQEFFENIRSFQGKNLHTNKERAEKEVAPNKREGVMKKELIRVRCSRCGGSGNYDDLDSTDDRLCPECEGDGLVWHEEKEEPCSKQEMRSIAGTR